MTYPSLESIIGRELKDSYGRYVGIIAGISTDGDGNIQAVGVDTGSKGFHKIEGDRITFEEETPILTSEWKLDSDSFLKTSGIAEKKMLALQELYEEGEISQDVFEHLTNRHKTKLESFSDKCEDTIANLNHKVESLSIENNTVNQFLGTLKLQHRIADMSDDVFRAANDYLGSILQNNEKEIANISTILSDIAPKVISADVETEEALMVAPEVSEEQSVSEVSVETEEPISTSEVSDETPEAPEYEMPTVEAPINSTEVIDMPQEIESPDVSLENNEPTINNEIENTYSYTENLESSLEKESQTEVSESPYTETFESPVESEFVQESTSFETPDEVTEVSEDITMDESEFVQESTSFETPDEVTEVSETQFNEIENTENTEETTDSEEVESLEINDSVSFDENSTETSEPTPSELIDTEENSTELNEEKVIYSE